MLEISVTSPMPQLLILFTMRLCLTNTLSVVLI
jgi:hypothetical protein